LLSDLRRSYSYVNVTEIVCHMYEVLVCLPLMEGVLMVVNVFWSKRAKMSQREQEEGNHYRSMSNDNK